MPDFPQYNRQVFTDPGRWAGSEATPSVARRQSIPYPEVVQRPKRTAPTYDRSFAEKMRELSRKQHDLYTERLKSQQRNAAIGTFLQGAQIIAGVVDDVVERRSATQIREATISTKASMQQFYDTMRRDPDYETYGERFDAVKEKLYDEQLKNISYPFARKSFEAEFNGLAAEYDTNLQKLALEKDHINGVASMNWQVEKAVELGDIEKVRDILFGYSYEGVSPHPSAQPSKNYVPGAVENGYISETKALEVAEAAVYTVNKNKAWETLKNVNPYTAKDIIADRENGSYTFAPFLGEKDRSQMAEDIQNAIDDANQVYDRRRDKARSYEIGNLYKKYNAGELTRGDVIATQTLWEQDWDFVDEETGKELKTLIMLLDNDKSEKSQNKAELYESLFERLELDVSLGLRPKEEAEAIGREAVKMAIENNERVIESKRYQQFKERINKPVHFIDESVYKNIEKQFNGTSAAIGSISEGGKVLKDIVSWSQSIMFDKEGNPTGKKPSPQEQREKMNELTSTYFARSVVNLMNESTSDGEGLPPEYMWYNALTGVSIMGIGASYKPPRANRRLYPKEWKAEEFSTTSVPEKAVNALQNIVTSGRIWDITPEEVKELHPLAVQIVNDYGWWLKKDARYWDAVLPKNRKLEVTWVNGLIPIFKTDKGYEFMMRFNSARQAEYFQRVKVYEDEAIIGYNAEIGEYEKISTAR